MSVDLERPTVRKPDLAASRPTAVNGAHGLSAVRPPSTRRPRRRRAGESMVAFVASVSLYIAVAALMLSRNVIFPDSVSRVANAYYVLFSRDPHLPAIGFVWNPLPSVLLLPLVALKGLFPVLTRDAFAGPLESSVFMAGAVVIVLRLLGDLGVARIPRRVLAALFAVSPLILIYGSSGLSEAMLLFFTLLTARFFGRWVVDHKPSQLVATGLALAGAYLTRYEAVAPACAVVLVVAVLSYVRARGRRRDKLLFALNDVLVVSFPFIASFVGWAAASRILVGSWFPTFTSDYGNTASVSTAKSYITRSTGDTEAAMAHYVADQLLGLEPFSALLLVIAVVVVVRRRQWALLAVPFVVAAVLAFDDLAFLAGGSYGWLRFQIAVIPLTVVLAGIVLSSTGAEAARGRRAVGGGHASRPGIGFGHRLTGGLDRARRRYPTAGTVLAVGLIAVSIPVSLFTVSDHRLAREETLTVLAAVDPGRSLPADRGHLKIYQTEHQVAASLDARRLPNGAVLTETQYAYDIVLASANPRQFIITSDADFKGALVDPAGHGVRYLLVPQTAGAPFDALDTQYPGLYENGGGIATLVQTWKSPISNSSWRLYRLNR